MGLYFVLLIRTINVFWGQVGGRVQKQSDPERGALPELLQQDLCGLGLLHHQPQRGGPEAQQPALRAPRECHSVFSWREVGLQLAKELVGARLSPVLSCVALCSFQELFAENHFLGLITLAPSMKLVNWGWEKR